MERGWVYYAASMERDGWQQFNGVKRQGKGYLGQEIDKLVAIALNAHGKA